MLREFGMSPADGEAVVTKLKEFYERTTLRHLPASPDVQMILNDSVIRGTQQMIDAFEALKEKGYEDTVLLGDQDVGKTESLTPENSETVWDAMTGIMSTSSWTVFLKCRRDLSTVSISY